MLKLTYKPFHQITNFLKGRFMKQALLVTVMMVLGLTAKAQNADMLYHVIECKPAVLVPDNGMSVSVFEGGFAGIPQMIVKHFYLGHTTSETFFMHRGVSIAAIGAPISYVNESETVMLSINFTTTPLKDGGHAGTLSTIQPNDALVTENLSCKAVNHPF